MNKTISVIIPVYNMEPFLAECLDSVLGQTYPHLQAICVNDGSRDRSREILEEYARRDPRVLVIDKENGETAKYNQSITLYNNAFHAFQAWYNRTHLPIPTGQRFLF